MWPGSVWAALTSNTIGVAIGVWPNVAFEDKMKALPLNGQKNASNTPSLPQLDVDSVGNTCEE